VATMEQWLVDLTLFGCVKIEVVDPDIYQSTHWEASLRRVQDEHVQARYFKTGASPSDAVRDLHMQIVHDVKMYEMGVKQ